MPGPKDLVERLRLTDPEAETLGVPELQRRLWEAADEIGRLRALVDEYQVAGEAWLSGLAGGASP